MSTHFLGCAVDPKADAPSQKTYFPQYSVESIVQEEKVEWTKDRVASHVKPNDSRPIGLTSFLLKIQERLLDAHIRKSVEIAPYENRFKIENGLPINNLL